MIHRIAFAAALSIWSVVPGSLAGQSTTVEHTAISSRILGEDRPLVVALPSTYETSSFRYPLLVLLDADSDFQHTSAIIEFLSRTDQIPEMIVVGIPNTNRSRDLTPPSDDIDETAFWDAVGGAAAFQRFISDELLPYVDSTYRTVPYRIIRGQSFGGLFSVFDYMSTERSFDAYLTSSAAVGWNSGELIARVPDVFGADRIREAAPERLPPLYVASAGRDFPGGLAAIREFVAAIEEARLGLQRAGMERSNFRWKHDHFPRERHYTVVLPGTIAGLRFLYENWQPPEEVEASSTFAAYEAHYARLSRDFGYEIRVPMRTVIRIGNQMLREQRYDEGIAIHQQNLRLYPDQPESHWHVADAFMLAGRAAESRPHFERAYELAVQTDHPDTAEYAASLEALSREER